MMLAEAAGSRRRRGGGGGAGGGPLSGRISDIIVLDPTENCPAAQAGASQIVADFRDRGAIEELARRSDIITYEIESGDSGILKEAEGDAVINPSPDTLRVIQDKLLQKRALSENGIAVAEFRGVASEGDLRRSAGEFGYPVLLKARRDAYDGRGNHRIDSPGAVRDAYARFGGRPVMVERLVPFQMEVSVIAARSTAGEIATYPPVENIHEDGILRATIAPARVGAEVAEKAGDLAERVMEVLHGAGVFGIEMFVVRGGGPGPPRLLVNEIAPRVHNSGHHSLQSSETSQFEQHLRAILGMPLGGTRLVRPTVMYNILGQDGFEGPYRVNDPGLPNTFLKMYGKATSKPRRKLGHVNIVAAGGEGVGDLLGRLEGVRGARIVEPAP